MHCNHCASNPSDQNDIFALSTFPFSLILSLSDAFPSDVRVIPRFLFLIIGSLEGNVQRSEGKVEYI